MSVAESVPAIAAAATPEAPVSATVESVGVDSAIAQVKSLVPGDASPGLLIGGAALLAVIGAAIKFGPGVLKSRAERAQQAHELELEKLRFERERQDDQHKTCATERASLEARVAALQAKVDALGGESGNGVSLGDFDPEDIEKRIAKIERSLKAKRGRA